MKRFSSISDSVNKRGSFHLLPDYGTILPSTGATFCHCRAQNEASWENFRAVYHRHSEYAFRLQDAWFCSWKTLLSILSFTLHLITKFSRHWRLKLVIIDGSIWVQRWFRTLKKSGWRVVKGGWRGSSTLHPYKHLAIRCLCLIGEGWRVFLKVAFYPPPPDFSIQSYQLRVQR